MASIVVAGDTSGAITIAAPAIAGTNTLTLPAATATFDAFPSGTAILFQQTAAPTGWTKSLANDNAALRVVSGTAGTGGSVNFTTAFASQTPAGTVSTSISAISGTVGTSGATTLTTSQIPSHSHSAIANSGGTAGATVADWAVNNAFGANDSTFGITGTTGGGSSHTHSGGTFTFSSGTASSSFTGTAINLAVKYVDAIVATKN